MTEEELADEILDAMQNVMDCDTTVTQLAKAAAKRVYPHVAKVDKRPECRGYCLAARNRLPDGEKPCPGCDYEEHSPVRGVSEAMIEAGARALACRPWDTVASNFKARLRAQARLCIEAALAVHEQ